MNEFVKGLGLNNCIRFTLGNVELLLDNFKQEYRGDFGASNLIIKANNNYFSCGWNENNKIISDLGKKGIEVRNLERTIYNKIAETVEKGLELYYANNKQKQFFNENDIYIYRDYSQLGKNPLSKIKERFKIYIEWNSITNNEIVISSCVLEGGKTETISYNLIDDKLCFNGESNRKTDYIIFENYCGKYDKNLYVLYKNYIENNLKGEDLAYKEIADLNKWLEKDDKTNVTVVYDKDGEEKEGKIRNCIDNMFSDLSREYYEEMLSFWGIDDIKSIKQIKGFKYRKDFYQWNIENLLYKKGK